MIVPLDVSRKDGTFRNGPSLRPRIAIMPIAGRPTTTDLLGPSLNPVPLTIKIKSIINLLDNGKIPATLHITIIIKSDLNAHNKSLRRRYVDMRAIREALEQA
jgi:hypothetical protein